MRLKSEALVKKLIRRYGSRDLWSIELALVSLPIYALASFAFDAVRVSDYSDKWIGIAILTYLEILLIGFAIKHFIPNRWWQARWAPLMNLALIAMAGAIKNSTVAILALNLGLEKNVDWFLRAVGGAFLTISISGLFVAIGGSRIEHLAAMSELGRIQRDLLGFRDNAATLASQQSADLIIETKSTIEPKLDKIEQLLGPGRQVSEAIDELRNLIRNEIRPLSKDLQQRAKFLSFKSDPVFIDSKTKTQLPATMSFSTTIYPFGNWTFSLLVQAWIIYMLFGSASAIWSAAASLPILLLAFALKTLAVLKIQPKTSIGFISIGVASVIATALNMAIYDLTLDLNTYVWVVLVPVLLTNFVSLGGAAYVTLIDRDRERLKLAMQRTNQALMLEMKLFEQQLWSDQKRWSYVLHGTVQATLTAAVTRLTYSANPEIETIELVKRDLEKTRKAISSVPQLAVDLRQEFSDLKETWRGICSISFEISDGAWGLLKADETAKLCLNEIAKEAVSNACRHGAAKNVEIKIQVENMTTLKVSISNDGSPISKSGQLRSLRSSGVGSRMLDELALDWQLSSNSMTGLTNLNLTLPISPKV